METEESASIVEKNKLELEVNDELLHGEVV